MALGGTLSALIALGLVGCNTPDTGGVATTPPPGESTQSAVAFPSGMDAAEAKAYVEAHAEVLLFDVRSLEEWNSEIGHIEGATLIPLPELAQRLGEIEAYKDREIITVCRTGRRSSEARRILMANGFKHVANLEGGMMGWRQAGY